jgi:hypothetical protein
MNLHGFEVYLLLEFSITIYYFESLRLFWNLEYSVEGKSRSHSIHAANRHGGAEIGEIENGERRTQGSNSVEGHRWSQFSEGPHWNWRTHIEEVQGG